MLKGQIVAVDYKSETKTTSNLDEGNVYEVPVDMIKSFATVSTDILCLSTSSTSGYIRSIKLFL